MERNGGVLQQIRVASDVAPAVENPGMAGPLERCPACDSLRLVIVGEADYLNFLCDACGRCWHVDFGRVSRVDPYSCRSCPRVAACLARGDDL